MNVKMELAREAVNLFLNTKIVAAEELFRYHDDDNFYVRMAHCFCKVLSAIMSFESGDLERCTELLKNTEKHISPGTSGLLNQISSSLRSRQAPTEADIAELLQRQIMLADCQVCLAVLAFLQQEIGSFIKGAVGLRRAWKTYERIYSRTDILNSTTPSDVDSLLTPINLSSSVHSRGPDPLGEGDEWGESHNATMTASCSTPCLSAALTPGSNPTSEFSDFSHSMKAPAAVGLLGKMTRSTTRVKLHPKSTRELSEQTQRSLAGSVSFGYGVFQLALSLVPENIIKIVHMLGFQSDRSEALAALDFCRKSEDFRAPLAGLVLLAYHSAIRPLLSLDGPNITAGVSAGQLLLSELQPLYPSSPLLCYFGGRLKRLQKDLTGSIESQNAAMSLTDQREIRLLCLHEIGWCYLLQLKWQEAFSAFSRLAEQTRWNRSFYKYLAAVTVGAVGDLPRARGLLTRLAAPPPSSSTASASSSSSGGTKYGSAEIGDFIDRRVGALTGYLLTSDDPADLGVRGQLVCRLLALELLYLWHALPSCSPEVWRQILADCRQTADRVSQLRAVAALVSGAVCDLTDLVAAEGHYRRAVRLASGQAVSSDDRGSRHRVDGYVAPFASYELAEIYCGRAQSCSDGRRLLISARDNYNNYEFQQRLNMRIQSALRRLDKQTGRK